MATEKRKSTEYDRDRQKGTGPAWEPAITAADWLRNTGYDPKTRTYRKDDDGS